MDANTEFVSALPNLSSVIALISLSDTEACRPGEIMNVVNIFGIVIFCGIVGLSLLAVLDVLFAPPGGGRKQRANRLKRRLAQVMSCLVRVKPCITRTIRNAAAARQQRRERSARHGGGST
jgi:hypothetical protein